jgi:hypothetical protein
MATINMGAMQLVGTKYDIKPEDAQSKKRSLQFIGRLPKFVGAESSLSMQIRQIPLAA